MKKFTMGVSRRPTRTEWSLPATMGTGRTALTRSGAAIGTIAVLGASAVIGTGAVLYSCVSPTQFHILSPTYLNTYFCQGRLCTSPT